MEWVESKRGKRKLSYEGYLYTCGGGRAGWVMSRVGNDRGGGLDRGEEAGGGSPVGKRRGEDAGGGGGPPRPTMTVRTSSYTYHMHYIFLSVFPSLKIFVPA